MAIPPDLLPVRCLTGHRGISGGASGGGAGGVGGALYGPPGPPPPPPPPPPLLGKSCVSILIRKSEKLGMILKHLLIKINFKKTDNIMLDKGRFYNSHGYVTMTTQKKT